MKNKPGRKPLSKNGSKNVSLRLSKDQYIRVLNLCIENDFLGPTPSDYFRRAIDRALIKDEASLTSSLQE